MGIKIDLRCDARHDKEHGHEPRIDYILKQITEDERLIRYLSEYALRVQVIAHIHKELLDEGIKNHVYILGVGNEQSKIEKYLHENNLTDSFTFLGYHTNPYKYVKACDFYVCSSLSEGFSTSVTEALIVGTPVVTTLCSGMQEMLGENNEYGIVTENNEDSLYEGVKRILTTPNLLGEYARKAFERGKYFSTEKTTKAVEELLLNL